MKRFRLVLALVMALLASYANATVISGVPAYYWTYGCSPTAAASVLGYWDSHGYGNLFGVRGVDTYQTGYVSTEIGQIATLMNTLGNGRTYVADFDAAIEGFTASKGYSGFDSSTKYFLDTNWLEYTASIDAGRPVMATVDTGGDRLVDHTVTGVGYELRGYARYYGYYDGWGEDETITWQPFSTIDSGYKWSVGWLTYLTPGLADAAVIPRDLIMPPVSNTIASVPEPSSLLLFAMGLVGLMGIKRMI